MVLENLDWAEVFEEYDGEETVFYCGPPYVGPAVELLLDVIHVGQPVGELAFVRVWPLFRLVSMSFLQSYSDGYIRLVAENRRLCGGFCGVDVGVGGEL